MLTARVVKRFQHRFNFDSTCFNTVEREGGVGANGFSIQHVSTRLKGNGGGEGVGANGFNTAVQQNRMDVEANVEPVCPGPKLANR